MQPRKSQCVRFAPAVGVEAKRLGHDSELGGDTDAQGSTCLQCIGKRVDAGACGFKPDPALYLLISRILIPTRKQKNSFSDPEKFRMEGFA